MSYLAKRRREALDILGRLQRQGKVEGQALAFAIAEDALERERALAGPAPAVSGTPDTKEER